MKKLGVAKGHAGAHVYVLYLLITMIFKGDFFSVRKPELSGARNAVISLRGLEHVARCSPWMWGIWVFSDVTSVETKMVCGGCGQNVLWRESELNP